MKNRSFHTKYSKLSSVSLAAMMVTSSVAAAQELVIEEVIVTATKRAESLMEVPLAIVAVTGDFAREANLNDVKDLVKFSPGVTGNSQDSFLDTITVRGIRSNAFGNGGDASIGIYKNGNYQGRNGSAVTSLFDVDRIEVLRGPQGFLFGRNAISGAISYHTVKASSEETSGYVELDVGERGVLVGEGAVNFPISENMGVRVAAYHSEENGWIKNLVNDKDLLAHNKDAVRVSLNFNNESLEANLMVEYEDRDQDGTVYRATGAGQGWDNLSEAAALNGNFAPPTATSSRKEVSLDKEIYDRGEVLSIGLQLDYQMDGMVLTSISGFRDHDYAYAEDFDGSDVELFYYSQDQTGKYYEQELRLSSDTDDNLSWYGGVSYYKEDIDTTFLGQQAEEVYCGIYWGSDCGYVGYYYGDTFEGSSDGQINDINRTIGKYQGYAAYLNLSYAVSDALDINAGIRYSYDKKEFSQETLGPIHPWFAGGVQAPQTDGRVSDTQDWDKLSWRIGLNYHLNDDTFLFANVTTGSKSGGFASFILNADGLPNSYAGESVVSYELGYKAKLWDGRAQVTLNAFHYNYKDLQQTFTAPGQAIVQIGNIGRVKSQGLEGTLQAVLSENLSVRMGGSYLDSSMTGVQLVCTLAEPDDCEGNKLTVPEWTFYSAVNFDLPVEGGEWGASLIYSVEQGIRSPHRLSNSNVEDMSLTVGFTSESGWFVKAYVENLLDTEGYDALTDTDVAPGDDTATNYLRTGINTARPRTFGARFGYEF